MPDDTVQWLGMLSTDSSAIYLCHRIPAGGSSGAGAGAGAGADDLLTAHDPVSCSNIRSGNDPDFHLGMQRNKSPDRNLDGAAICCVTYPSINHTREDRLSATAIYPAADPQFP